MSTGGPEEVGAQVTVTEALENAVVGVQANQGERQPHNYGGWNYGRPGGEGDLSVTQFSVAGLSAAENVREGAIDSMPRLIEYLMADQAPNGGLRYRPPNHGPTPQMTASGLWCYRLAEVPVE